MTTVYYDTFTCNQHYFNYAYTEQGICFVGSPNHDIAEMASFVKSDELIKKPSSSIKKELLDYLSGKLTIFDLPFDLSWSTDFQKKVYTELRKVRYGETVDYSQLATAMKRPTATRAVASAVAKNPILFLIPCHRVIRKDGSLGGFRAGLKLKQQLLELEKR